MSLKAVIKVAQALWSKGLSEKAAKFVQDKANAMLLDEKSDRAAFQDELEHYTDDDFL